MEKYGGISDIDTDAQDVFETSDVDSEIGADFDQESESKTEVEELTVDLSTVREKYARDVVIGDMALVDFSGSVQNPVLGKTGYVVGSVDETVDQKLQRIARELQEIRLIEEKEGVSRSSGESSDTLIELLENIQSGIQNTNVNTFETRLDNVFESATRKVNQPFSQNSTGAESATVNPSEILTLESRIYGLEKAIGMDNKSQSIQNVLNDLGRKVKVIHNPEYPLEKVKEEITQLNLETEQLASQRKLLEITESLAPKKTIPTEVKVDELYGRMPDFDRTNKIVPSIIERLRSLNTVHADIGHAVEVVKDLDQVLSDMNGELVSWDTSINELEKNLAEYAKNVDSNKVVVEEKIKTLQAKVESLEKTNH